MKKSEPTLSGNRVLVVQFRTQPQGPSPPSPGRVEHVVSGRASHFDSWEKFQEVIEQTLTGVSEKPP